LLSHVELSLMNFHELEIHIELDLEVLLVQFSSIDEHLVFNFFKLVTYIVLHQQIFVVVVVDNPLRLLVL
jgi:hypothetical protein